ncbi:hypothetical protein E8E11_004658 [Didymella keratinophila]|nr:hypothetical protein E8E11_004658 [Didymella keratinophila]
MSPPTFLCYRQAYRKRKAGKITEEKYFHEILQHLMWEHDCDDEDDDNDAMGRAVQWICSDCVNNNLLISDTAPFEEILLAYRRGSKEDIESKLNNVPEASRSAIRKALAYCALREGDAQSLKWMLDGCLGQMGQAFEYQAYRVRKQSGADEKAAELWKVVEESRFEVPSEWKGRKSMHPPGDWDIR